MRSKNNTNKKMAVYKVFVILLCVYFSDGQFLRVLDKVRAGIQRVLFRNKENGKPHVTQVTQKTQVTEPQASSSPSTPAMLDKFDDLYENYRALLISDYYEETNTGISKYVETLSKEAGYLYKKLDQTPNRIRLWTEAGKNKPSSLLKKEFHKLRNLTLAYGTKGTEYYKKEDLLEAIKDSLEFLVAPGRYDGKIHYGNWWNWQVGIPTNFLDILVIIKTDLKSEKIKQYINIISEYIHDPYHKLSNTLENYTYTIEFTYNIASSSQIVELARVVLGLGILQKNETKIFQALDTIFEVMEPVTESDGFYEDGSYLEHKNIPYTGSYGSELVRRMGDILVITQSSKFDIPPEQIYPIVKYVERAFLPLVYRGEMIATVRGREVTREPLSLNPPIGSDVMYTLLTIAEFASSTDKKLKESLKYWIQKNQEYYFSNAKTYNEIVLVTSLLNDPSIVGAKFPFIGAKMYASMDRFVQQTDKYTLGISLYSNRISAFEAGNSENKRGWHTADGAVYLYNYDDVQFRNAYWPTVDPYRFPGTTVDTIQLEEELTNWQAFYSKANWVGGVADRNQAVVGMDLNKEGFKNNNRLLPMNLKGKKSWFVVEGQIVALGAAINGRTTASIETIVENRLLNNKYKYKVWSNKGEIKTTTKGYSVNWLVLQSSNHRLSIAYYFPNNETVDVIFEQRKGTYRYINDNYSINDFAYTGSYRKFIIRHGQRPVNANYSYVLLPGVTKSELKEYVSNNPVNILINTAEIQAVEIISKGYLGINIWSETGGSIAGISSDKPVSLMRQTYSAEDKYVVSDPSQTDKVITIKIPRFSRVVTMSEGIEFDVVNKEFVVDFKEARGGSKQFIVNILDVINEVGGDN